MKLKELQKKLETDYIIHKKENYICFCSNYCPDVITYNLITKNIITLFNMGSNSIVYKKLEKMIENNEIDEYINGDSDISDTIIKYSVADGKIIEHIIDVDYPYVDINGVLLYNNLHFSDKQEAIKSYIKNTNYTYKDWYPSPYFDDSFPFKKISVINAYKFFSKVKIPKDFYIFIFLDKDGSLNFTTRAKNRERGIYFTINDNIEYYIYNDYENESYEDNIEINNVNLDIVSKLINKII